MSDKPAFSALGMATVEDMADELRNRGMKFVIIALPSENDTINGFQYIATTSRLSDALFLVEQWSSRVQAE